MELKIGTLAANIGEELSDSTLLVLVSNVLSDNEEVDVQIVNGGIIRHIQKSGLFPLSENCSLMTLGGTT